ncbi:serine/threonine protein phosphatase [Enterococcus sp. JM4C]|uniref:formylglycine-generating enzyme family protein n=1 Tax=Candidatus Enterococcus huntleyi TaxID=1857217 RepID=UPI00137AE263|nr:formylglycine-generating enzyme family protein [Enterococcus sp. JM4C]KAF1299218.1 serine/threonine protein phosphatase [Enterococcus sp. JM4C]
MIQIPKGEYIIGTEHPDGFLTDREGPKSKVSLSDFWIDETTITNREFRVFVEATGYITEAERFGWSFVFSYFLDSETKRRSPKVPNMAWWYAVSGADWRHPEGANSDISQRMDHPVVQVSRNDALAYCRWAKKKLPTEAQWEVAAKGGTDFERYPWGEDFLLNGQHHCNIWQGNFPQENTEEDGFSNTAPAKYYEPNGYGLYQMIGNVWEWCSNPARIPLNTFQTISSNEMWENYQNEDDQMYAIRGGSFLCHQSYCKRYRIAARNGNSGMSTANNLGFRCVKD